MSNIFPYTEKDHSPKLIRFIKLLSRFDRDNALRLLPDFTHESYYGDLDRLLQHVMLITDLQNDTARERQINMRIKAETIHLNNRLAEESSRYRPTNMTDHQYHLIQVATYLQANQLSKGQTLAKVHNLEQLQRTIQELQEYRWLKQHASRNSETRMTSPPRFESMEGERLRQLVENQSSCYISTISFFKSQFQKIIQNQTLSEVPPHLFEEDFRKCYEDFIKKLRQMRNHFHDFQRPLKEKVLAFSRKIGLQMDQSAQLNKCVDSLFQSLDGLLEYPQKQKIFYRRSLSNMSDLSYRSESSISMSNEPNQIKFGKPMRKRQRIFAKQQQIRLEDIYKIISRHLPTDKDYPNLSPQRKMAELLSKVKQLCNEIERIRDNDEQFIQSFQITENILQEFSQGRNSLDDHLPAELPNIKSTDEPSISQLKVATDRLLRELSQARQNTATEKKSNAHLIQRIKDYQARINLINIDTYKSTNCQSTLMSLKEENVVLKESIEKLKQQVQIKTSQINNFQISRNEDRKKFQKEKQRAVDIEKVKLNKLRDDYDDLMDRLTNMNNLYEERFLINQKTPEQSSPLNSSFIKTKKERDQLRQEIMMLSGENEVLKQQLNRETHEIAIGMSQDGSFVDQGEEQHQSSSGSFIRHLNLQSKMVPPCNSEQMKAQMEEIEQQNYQLSKQIEEKNISNIYMETNNRELRQTIKTLSAQNQQLSSRLRTLQIRSVTHNQQNLPTLHLFPPGFIFEDHDYQERLFLIENLQSYTGPIRRTRLIYRADPHNRTNFHKYIDKQRHVVAIFKTIYGKLIAGYSEQAFDASGIIRGHGMLFSLWGRKAFGLQEKRAISYDDYFLIFGNSQLRIKTGEYRLFSNFGIANSYYNNRGEKVHSLLGEDKEREVDLSHFQVYALDLES